MGYLRHDAVIALIGDYSAAEKKVPALIRKLKREWPEGLPKCILGPTLGVNGYNTWVFAPDGSKEGWDSSDLGDAMRSRFMEIMKAAGAELVHLQFGGDDGETKILYSTDRRKGW